MWEGYYPKELENAPHGAEARDLAFYNRIIVQTDWRALQREKEALNDMARAMEKRGDNKIDRQRIFNILAFIDRIQDAAVEIYGVSEDEVFDGAEGR